MQLQNIFFNRDKISKYDLFIVTRKLISRCKWRKISQLSVTGVIFRYFCYSPMWLIHSLKQELYTLP